MSDPFIRNFLLCVARGAVREWSASKDPQKRAQAAELDLALRNRGQSEGFAEPQSAPGISETWH